RHTSLQFSAVFIQAGHTGWGAGVLKRYNRVNRSPGRGFGMRLQVRSLGLAMLGFASAGLVASSEGAQAGGFSIREQSAQYQGMSYAGSASGGALSSIFW